MTIIIRPDPSPYPLVGDHGQGPSTVYVRDVAIGGVRPILAAGPCAVETPEQTYQAACMAHRAGATLLRGGAYKPRTSPYAFQGLAVQGLKILTEVSIAVGLPFVTEVLDTGDVDTVAAHADMLQVGARNMHNFALLRAVGTAGKPVLLKRGVAATIEEFLLAAEYIAQAGGEDIVLCERGIRTFETATRFTLDIAAVPVVRSRSHLPVIVDPSHAAGKRRFVLPLAAAALAAGADGLLIEMHPDPAKALCDGAQALVEDDVLPLAAIMGRAWQAYDGTLGERAEPNHAE
jgi:3-deoxy-7-phosphoheptulonate synthase